MSREPGYRGDSAIRIIRILVEAATAIEIPETALPEELRDNSPGTPGRTPHLLSK